MNPRMSALLSCLAWIATPEAAIGAESASRQRAEGIDPEVMTEGFLAAHPDLRWRREGNQAYANGDHALALTYFMRAAHYADKPSQALLADMYWRGQGTAVDRAIAYAWMDVAAERLYPDFIVFRERYWNQLGPSEREDALVRGQEVLAEYGDDVAKPRLEAVLRKHRRKATGSRTGGATGNMTIIVRPSSTSGPIMSMADIRGTMLRADEFYDDRYWEPAQYWQLQDEVWSAPLRGRVRVGEVERAGDAPAAAPDEDGD